MKTPRISKLIRSQLSRWIFGCTAAIAMAATPLKGEVNVAFNNTTIAPSPTSPTLGTVTLAFTVDGSGNVTLDASTSNTASTVVVDAVNAWDGAVGTITDPGAYNSTFTLTLKGVGSGNSQSDLKLSNQVGGSPIAGVMGLPGGNQYRVDNNVTTTPANNEYIQVTATSVPAGSKLKLTSMGWNNSNGTGNYSMRAFRTAAPSISLSNPVGTQTGTWDLSTSGVLLDAAQVINFGTVTSANLNNGYSFKALGFDIVSASTLSAPGGLVASTNGQSVVLDWNDTANATSYSVYRSTTASGPYGTAIATGVATSAYTDTTVSTGTTYYYVVTASDASTESANSTEASIAVLIPAPTGLTRTQSDATINLDWDDSTSPIFASYSVYRSTTSGGPYTSIATGLTTSAYADTGLTNGTKYYYVVRAIDNVASAESANSAQVVGAPYVPVSGSTLYANLDGSVTASVTADGSNIVSAWADQTANGFNAVSNTGSVVYPSATKSESGLDGLDMGTPARTVLSWFNAAQQDSWLDFSSGAGALPYGGFSVYAVVHPSAILGGINRDVVMSSTESEFSLRYEAGKAQVRLGGTQVETTTAAVTAGQTVVLAVRYDASTGAVQLWDSESGVITTGNIPAADFSSAANIFVGGSGNPDQYMKGMLGEVKVYRGLQTTTEFLYERANLVEKWVGAPVPSGVTATPGVGKVDLAWTKAKPYSAYTYSVYRSTSSSGPYTLLAGGLVPNGDNAPITYSDTTVVAGTTYYYVVTSTNTEDSSESVYSTEVSGGSVGPVLHAHLNGSISGSVTADGSNIVSAWADQTANGFNATSTGGAGTAFYPSSTQTQSGANGLDMGLTVAEPAAPKSSLQWFTPVQQDQWLDFSPTGAALAKGGFAVLAVVHPTAILGGVNRDVVMSSTESEFALRYEGGRPQVRLGVTGAVGGPTILQGTAGAVTAGRTVVLAVSYDAATGSLKLWDSNSRTTTTATVAAADFSSPASVFLGGSANPDQYMKGVLGEVKLYTGLMTETELINNAKSMVATWGLPELTWTGAESSEWSTNVLPGAKNWSAYGPVAKDFASASAVVFDSTATNKIVDITGADVTPFSVAFNSGSYTLQGSNKIAGSAPVSVATGATLKLGSANVLPSGAGTGNLTINGTLDLNGNTSTINGLAGSGSVDNTAAATDINLTLGANGGGTNFTGAIKNTAGTLALIKSGATDISLNGINTYSGATTVNQGRLVIRGASSLPSSTAVSVNNGASLIFNVTATGTPATAPTYAQNITLASGSNLSLRKAATLSSVALPTSGSVKFNYDDAATVDYSLASNVALAGSLDIQVGGSNATMGAVTLSGIFSGTGGSLVKSGPGALTIGGVNTFDGGVTIKGGTLNVITSSSALGTGAVTMGGVGSTGATFITGRALTNAFTINAPDSGTVVIGANGAGSGYSLSGAITLAGDLTIQTNNNPVAFSQTTGLPILATAGITGGITGTGNLVLNNLGLSSNVINITTAAINHTGSITVQGTATGNTTIGSVIGSNVTGITQNSATSTLVLSGANTYACNLTINAGTVRISNNTNTGNDASTVSIAATGATLNLTYSGTDTVAKLIIDSVEQPAGVYGKVGSTDPSVTQQIAQITGDGTLTVGVPDIAVEQPVDTVITSGDSQDFGTVEAGSNNELTFTIRNSGSVPLNLTGTPAVAISGTNEADFTVTGQPTGPVAAGSTTTFTVQFAPSAEGGEGERSATLTIASNDGDQASYVINLTGMATVTSTGAPEIVVEQPAETEIISGGSQGFGTVTLGSDAGLTFTIRNSGTAELSLIGNSLVAISGANADDFTVTTAPSASVAAAGTTTFTVTFAPSAAGERNATLTIESNDSDEGSYVINLTGTGQSAFDAWSGGAAFDADANGDGVSNGLAWILGAADPSADARSLLPSVSTTATNMVFTFKRSQASINASTALSVEVGTTLAAWSTTYTVGADTADSTSGVTIAKDSPSAGTDTVTVTVARGSDGKKFARLKAVLTP